MALVKGMFTATTILPQTEAPKQVVPLGAKRTIIFQWLLCVGRSFQGCHMQTLLTPAAPNSVISSVSTTVITNFVFCSLHGIS